MFDLKYLMLVIIVAVLLPTRSCRSMDLDVLVNKTLCAFVVEYDRDINRIPYIIKSIKCAGNSKQICADNNIEKNNCCDQSNNMECVQMKDTVFVFDKTANKTKTIEVLVGCTCEIQSPTEAKSVDPTLNSGR